VSITTSLDAARWSNILRLDRAFGAGEVTLTAGPLEAYVEVAARCNLRCQMCPITVDPRYDPGSGRPGLFAPELFDRLEPFFPTLQRVYLIGLGEPTLHAGLVDFTRRLAEVGVEVWVTTNATLMDDEQAEALALAGLAHVSVSIDGGTAETYERIRVRGKFDHVVRGLKALGRARQRHGRPEIWLNVVATASNVPELVQLVELCAEAGGDGLFVEGLYPYPHPAIEEFCRNESLDRLGEERVRELFAAAAQRAAELGIRWMTRLDEQALNAPKAVSELEPEPGPEPEPALVFPPAAPGPPDPAETEPLALPFPCSEPWSNLNINASGEVRPCCFNDIVLGDLNRQSIEEIWNGPGYTALRRDMAEGRVPETCATCVRNGRVKRNAFLSLRDPALDTSPGRSFVLELPGDGSLVDGRLVLLGRRNSLLGRVFPQRFTLPDVYINDSRIAGLGDWAVSDGSWVAAVIPVPYVEPGGHRLSLRPPGGSEAESWAHRWLQFGSSEATLAAASRLGIPLWFLHREPRPELLLDGRPHPIERWICGQRDAHTWIGVALVSVAALAPGSYGLEMRFRHQPPWQARLERLA
jgi:MoaA/NifB/PqqE/SkfB family radical SAM enzyme